VLNAGRVSTNVFLRRIQNYCIGMKWLPSPLLSKKQFPPVKFKEKRAITLAEHQRIIEGEENPERRAFYELCWHLGGSQTDIASLHAEDIDGRDRTLAYTRRKSRSPALQRFGESVERILKDLPQQGPLLQSGASARRKPRARCARA
jgi:integrase